MNHLISYMRLSFPLILSFAVGLAAAPLWAGFSWESILIRRIPKPRGRGSGSCRANPRKKFSGKSWGSLRRAKRFFRN